VETKPGRFELRNVTLGPVLTDKAIVLAGVKPGEQVATSGNFLIDSQMQLAGKPSLIDPTRYVVSSESEHRNTPLQFDSISIKTVEGTPGEHLEQLYQAYFEIQQALAADKLPSESAVAQLVSLPDALSAENVLPKGIQPSLAVIKQKAEHLHHLSLEQARQKFKPISHEIVTLATELRGAGDRQPFHQFFCPMVKEGEGDWLQADPLLSNPYYGSEMLRCGELVRTIPAATSGTDQPTSDEPKESGTPTPAPGGNP
jgi:membrane fusion protein, copper/silver efflux system